MLDSQLLIDTARKVKDNAYAKYSGYAVGTALLGKNGKIYTGVNVENASYGATICAERNAVGKAVSDGCTDFEAIAIIADEERAFPCGICRQVLAEFSPKMKVLIEDKGRIVSVALEELLPHPFSL